MKTSLRHEAGDLLDIAIKELEDCANWLEKMGISEYCVFDPGIVRGLAYYTGIVFEVHDIKGELRAICGGGRFDNLLHDFGGPKITATGMGMGDCVLEILLREKGLLDKKISARDIDYFVLPVSDEFLDESVKLAMKLRTKGFKTVFTYKAGNISKLLKNASEQNAKYCVIIGDEFKAGNIAIKDMASGQQKTVPVKDFLENPGQILMKEYAPNHYEKAFENWLIDNHVEYVAASDQHKPVYEKSELKSFDFLLCPHRAGK